jgi:hypothetical protein
MKHKPKKNIKLGSKKLNLGIHQGPFDNLLKPQNQNNDSKSKRDKGSNGGNTNR